MDKFTAKLPDKEIRVDKSLCEKNFAYWQGIAEIGQVADNQHMETSEAILPAHTFAYHYLDDKTGKRIYPIEHIFGYDRRTGEFGQQSTGLVAKAFRNLDYVPDLHMGTSKKFGHDIFLFAYHGVHNPYHRQLDAVPVRPFGLFIKKDCEEFAYCHGTPCDIAEANPAVDRAKLDKYYLTPEDLRTLKANQVSNDPQLKQDFWYYYGDPEVWKAEDDYGKNIYTRTGEFRYYGSIKVDSIAAILWPHFIDVVREDNTPDMDSNLDFINAFRKKFSTHENESSIQIIEYLYDIEDENEWDVALVEASYLSTRFYLEKGYFPKDIQALKENI